jgi:hypothetical protein
MKRLILIAMVLVPLFSCAQNIFDTHMTHSQYNLPGSSGALFTYTTPYWSCSSSGYSDFFYAKDFGFNIPANAHINGIRVDIDVIISNLKDSSVQLLKNGVPYGNDGAYHLPIIYAGVIHWGDSTSLWGATWTPADFNDSGFGVRIRVKDTGGTTPFIWSQANPVYITVIYDTLHNSGISSAVPIPLKVYPNPSTGMFEIDFGASATDCTIRLQTQMGQLCKEIKNIHTPTYQLDVSDLAAGVYFLEVSTPTGSVRTKLVRE